MSKPSVFVSSTYVDLSEVRSSLRKYFNKFGFDARLFERGGVYYDPTKTLERSCVAEVNESDLFVLVIGGRYGSSVSVDNRKKGKLKDYNSITKSEYLAAQKAGIPIYTFVKAQVCTEMATYRKNPR